MLNFSKTRIAFIYLVFLFLILFVFLNFIDIDKPLFKKKINLGLDLQGGSYLLLEVDSTLLEKKALQSKVLPLKKKLKDVQIEFDNFSINDKKIQFSIDRNDIKNFGKYLMKNTNNFNTF